MPLEPAQASATAMESGTTDADSRDYLVTVMKHIGNYGELYAFVARVTMAQPITWVREHIGELTDNIVSYDRRLRTMPGPVVALYIQPA